MSLRVITSIMQRGNLTLEWPCRVLFPAYQMRAFEKGLAELPYRPQLEDHPYARVLARPGAESRGDEEDADLE